MDTLTEEIWDIVIAGTSLPQSLLALSLSKSGKKVLHVDRNDYYGGQDAAFSLQEAEQWVQRLNEGDSQTYTDASLQRSDNSSSEQPSPSLAPSRSYTLSLNPQIIYAQSSFLPTLVSSQIHTQLEFLAVGSWWVLRDGTLQKIPSSREDVFSDDSIPMRDKRSLMKFLRFALQPDEEEQTEMQQTEPQSFKDVLQNKFNVPESLQSPILALALSSEPATNTDFDTAVQHIRRHMRSIGYFGPGFGAVLAKYGGNAEVAQVACRAQAVGGGVYLLGHAINDIQQTEDQTEGTLLQVTLSDGTVVRARRVVGSRDDLSTTDKHHKSEPNANLQILHSVTIVSGSLKSLFPATSESGPVPAAAIVLVEDRSATDFPPIYLQIHSEDTGECPAGQCVVYASIRKHEGSPSQRLSAAVDTFLASLGPESDAKALWSLSYTSHRPAKFEFVDRTNYEGRLITMPDAPFSIALDDTILESVEAVWKLVMVEEAHEGRFLRFEERGEEQSEGEI